MTPYFLLLCYALFPLFFSGCPETLFGKENEWEKGFPGVNNNFVVFPLYILLKTDRKKSIQFPRVILGQFDCCVISFFSFHTIDADAKSRPFFLPEPQMFPVFSFFPLRADNWEEKE